ncbi:MAG: amidohydrolase [Bacteroidales bacterium]|nr:amidohydrolase [Bacteroidales bacterium]
MQDLNIALVQSSLVWEDVDANLAAFDQKLNAIPLGADLVMLPEMFNTGFSMNPKKIAEKPDGKSLKWLQQKAVDLNCVITGSILTEMDGRFYNRLYWVHPEGAFDSYDKRHLFRLGEEFKVFTAGSERMIFHLKGWNILPLICYDLRFPVWIKNRFIDQSYEYDLILCIANWPAVRQYAWNHLLIARAIENQAYVAAVNRVGDDGNGLAHTGDSAILDPQGQVITKANPSADQIITATLSKRELHEFRQSFTVGLDWDEFEMKHK